MNSKERVKTALNHNVPDKLPVDFGSSQVILILSQMMIIAEIVHCDKILKLI